MPLRIGGASPRRRRPAFRAWLGLALLLATAPVRATDDPPPILPGPFTLRDATMHLPPLAQLAPELAASPRLLEAPSAPPDSETPQREGGPLSWQFRYQRSKLDTMSSRGLRTDTTTGFSRELDRDVLELGMTWRLAGSRIGVGYELQASRELDEGFSRFLPGSASATHALTLGVTREFGRGAPPPPPAPPLGLVPPPTRALDIAPLPEPPGP